MLAVAGTGCPPALPGAAWFKLALQARLCPVLFWLQQPPGCSEPVWPVSLCAFGTNESHSGLKIAAWETGFFLFSPGTRLESGEN